LRRAARGLAAVAFTLAGTAYAQSEDVPFVVTPGNVTAAMLDIAGVKAGDTVIDLGSGDGRIVIGAAKRGAQALGVEIDKRLVDLSIENARREGVSARARFAEQDLFKTDLSKASVITMYLLPGVNLQLRPSLLALAPGTRIVSHDWDMGEWQPDKSITVPAPEKKIGLEKSSRVHLWVIPARLQGLWCAARHGERIELRFAQTFQDASGESAFGGKGLAAFKGRISGKVAKFAHPQAESLGEFTAAWGPGGLTVVKTQGVFVPLDRVVLKPAGPSGTCPS
jgi:SAM-dependent methyltransferase